MHTTSTTTTTTTTVFSNTDYSSGMSISVDNASNTKPRTNNTSPIFHSSTSEASLTTRELSISYPIPEEIWSLIINYIPSYCLLNARLISKLYRDLIEQSNLLKIHCTLSQLCSLNKQDTENINPRLRIKLNEVKNVKDLTNFVKNPFNKNFLDRLETITLETNQPLIELFSQCKLPLLTSLSFPKISGLCPQLDFSNLSTTLTSISFGYIQGFFKITNFPVNLINLSFKSVRGSDNGYLTIPEFPSNLKSLSFETIDNTTLYYLQTLPDNLTNLSLGNAELFQFPTKKLPNNLSSLSFGQVRFSNQCLTNIQSLPSLTSLSFDCISSYNSLDFSKLPTSLTSLSLGYISIHEHTRLSEFSASITSLFFKDVDGQLTISSFPQNLITLSFDDINNYLEIPLLPNSTISLSFKNINGSVRIPLLPNNLKSLNFGNITGKLNLPTTLPNSLTLLFFETCENRKIKQMLEDFQASIKMRNAANKNNI